MQRRGDGGKQRQPMRMDDRAARSEVCRAAAGRQQERAEHQQKHGRNLRDSENVLHQAAEPDAEVIHRRKQNDQRRRQAFSAEVLQWRNVADAGDMDRPARGSPRQLRHVREILIGVFREDVSHGGNRAGLDDRKDGPTIKEGRERAVHPIEIDILAAGLRDHAGNLRVRERPEQRDDSCQGPDAEQQFRRADLRGHHPRLAENAGADDAAHDHHDRGEQAEGGKKTGA